MRLCSHSVSGRGIFIVPHLVWQGASGFKFYPEDPVFNRKLATGDHFYTGYSWNLNYPVFYHCIYHNPLSALLLSDMVFAFSRSKLDVSQMFDLCTSRECSSWTTSQYLIVSSKHSIAPKDDERIHVISGENVNIYKTSGTQTRLPIKAQVCPRFPKTINQYLVWSASSHGFVAARPARKS